VKSFLKGFVWPIVQILFYSVVFLLGLALWFWAFSVRENAERRYYGW